MSEKAPSDSPSAGIPTHGSAASPKSNNPLLQSIKRIVSATNSALASFEEVSDETSSMIVSRLRVLGKQGQHIAARALGAYGDRERHGAQIVAGSAVAVGGIVALRRGRIPGALAGGLAGAAAYGGVYGYEDYSATSWRNSIPKIG
ncbi:hypothetical protein ACHAWF_003611 [Thalassiosira exigua]